MNIFVCPECGLKTDLDVCEHVCSGSAPEPVEEDEDEE
jgi:hypothetical protein